MTQPTYPTPPRRRTSPLAILAVVGATAAALLVVGVIVVMVASQPDSTSPSSHTDHLAPAGAPATHPAGSSVTEGRWEFRVAQTDTARRVHGDGGSRVAQNGHFVEVWLAVTNHAAKARFISADDQHLLAGAKSYDVDVDATVTVDQGPEVGLPEKINPGSTETIELVYDVPGTVRPTGVEVHSSDTSTGVRVALPST